MKDSGFFFIIFLLFRTTIQSSLMAHIFSSIYICEKTYLVKNHPRISIFPQFGVMFFYQQTLIAIPHKVRSNCNSYLKKRCRTQFLKKIRGTRTNGLRKQNMLEVKPIAISLILMFGHVFPNSFSDSIIHPSLKSKDIRRFSQV